MKHSDVRIVATGLYTPPHSISNDELVAAFNAYVEKFNSDNAARIEAGELEPLQPSSSEFIEKASGIKARYVVEKEGVLDIARMAPRIAARPNEELSLLAEMAVAAARDAMRAADLGQDDIDGVICAASNMQRAYPAIAVEIQNALGIEGFAFDMNVACASAATGIETGLGLIRAGSRRILMVNPEICSAHLNFRNRDCHFIFGDVATAVILERSQGEPSGEAWDILGTRLKTKFSNNIRNNNGFLRRTREGHMEDRRDMLFRQEGRKVFKQVVPIVTELILGHLADNDLKAGDLSRLWLHQANKGMNDLIGARVLGREPAPGEQPNILQDYANTSSAGSIIAFSKFSSDLQRGDLGVICSFGAGYSAGSVILRKI
ncbi:MAG: beta-ketoacyl-ACP synthase III [Oricola sp.]|nr:beta-ketoacyl-ACP synthase III [Oricola sp.]